MSGGHFDYIQYRIGEIASEVVRLIETNESNELNEYGEVKGHHYPPEIIARFKEAVVTLKKAEIYAQRIDWLVSGDDGETTFLQRLQDDLLKVGQ